MTAPVLSAKEIDDLLWAEFPQMMSRDGGFAIEHVAYGTARVRKPFNANSLRPGGTISGPTMMGLADLTLYVAVFSVVGREPLAVTTNLNINFLRKPAQADLIAEARLLKIGRRLVVGEVTMRTEDEGEPVAHVTATYSVPPHVS